MPGQRPESDGLFAITKEASHRGRATVGILVTFAVLLTGALGAAPVSAGTYEMLNCSVPGRGDWPLDPWTRSDTPETSVTMVDACLAGGGFGITVGGTRQLRGGTAHGISLQKPIGPGTQIKFVKLKLWYAARLAGTGQALYFGSGDARSDGSHHSGLVFGPPGSEEMVSEQQLSPDTTDVQLGIQCGPGGVVSPEPCVPAHDVPLLIRGVEVTLSEDVQPIAVAAGGTLLEDGPQSGIRTVSYSAADAQSGLSKVEVLLDERLVASHDMTPRCHYGDFTVCPASLDGTLEVDTRAVPNGPHRMTLRVQDAAGNQRLVQREQPVDVVNEPPAGSRSAFSVVAKFSGTSRTTITAPYGRRVVVRGRLTRESQPVGAGVPLEVLERLDRKGERAELASRVATKADGSFTAVIATNRPSRVVLLAYREAGGSPVVSRALKVRVRAASRLRASLRGRVVRFSGRVISGPVAKRGKRVLMEGRSPGSAWTQFKSVRTNRSGQFSGTYRLRVRRPGVLLKIRAVVPTEEGYGYVSARSRAVTLRVR